MSLLRALRAYVGLGPDEDYEEHNLSRRSRPNGDSRRDGGRSTPRGSYLDDYYGTDSGQEVVDIRTAGIDTRLAHGSGSPTVARKPNHRRDRSGVRNAYRQQSLTENDELLEQIPNTTDSTGLDGGGADAIDGAHFDSADFDGAEVGSADFGDDDSQDEDSRGAVVRSIDSARSRPRTLNPESFSDAKHVADEFKRGTPVVVNMQGLERDLTRRLVDFASGICYALDGSMEKLAPQVFLLTPDGLDVSDTDRRRIEERGYAR